jgi:hypothetical protein
LTQLSFAGFDGQSPTHYALASQLQALIPTFTSLASLSMDFPTIAIDSLGALKQLTHLACLGKLDLSTLPTGLKSLSTDDIVSMKSLFTHCPSLESLEHTVRHTMRSDLTALRELNVTIPVVLKRLKVTVRSRFEVFMANYKFISQLTTLESLELSSTGLYESLDAGFATTLQRLTKFTCWYSLMHVHELATLTGLRELGYPSYGMKPQLSTLTNLENLRVSTIDDHIARPLASNLKSLRIGLSESNLNVVPCLTSLRSVVLVGDQFRASHIPRICGLPHLTEIGLCRMEFNDIVAIDTFFEMMAPSLTALILDTCDGGRVWDFVLKHLTRLETISLNSAKVSVSSVLKLRKMTGLQTLKLCGADFVHTGLVAIDKVLKAEVYIE